MVTPWCTIDGVHYNTAVIWQFEWEKDWVNITLITGEIVYHYDPGKTIYRKLCDTVMVRGKQ